MKPWRNGQVRVRRKEGRYNKRDMRKDEKRRRRECESEEIRGEAWKRRWKREGETRRREEKGLNSYSSPSCMLTVPISRLKFQLLT